MQAFEWFGGVFPEIRFDNLSSAVKKVLKGRRRVESDRFVALRSHYLFESQFTTPGLEGAHEKGGVEGEVGRFRRNHLVPVPQLRDLAELNAMLLAGCEQDLARRIDGRPVTVGQAWAVERPLLLALPAERVRRVRDRDAAGRCEVAGHDPSEPLLGAGRARRAEGQRPDRREGDHDQPLAAGRSPATSGCTASSGPARSSITTSSCSQRKPGGLEHSRCAQPGARARRLARVLRRAVGRADRALRTLGRRPADGRRRAALPRARPRPGGARRPRRAGRGRDRRTRRRTFSPAARRAPRQPRRRR